MRRGKTDLQQLHQVQETLRRLQPTRHLQAAHRRLAWGSSCIQHAAIPQRSAARNAACSSATGTASNTHARHISRSVASRRRLRQCQRSWPGIASERSRRFCWRGVSDFTTGHAAPLSIHCITVFHADQSTALPAHLFRSDLRSRAYCHQWPYLASTAAANSASHRAAQLSPTLLRDEPKFGILFAVAPRCITSAAAYTYIEFTRL